MMLLRCTRLVVTSGKVLLQVKAHLVAKNAGCACASAVRLVHAMLMHMAQKGFVLVRLHGLCMRLKWLDCMLPSSKHAKNCRAPLGSDKATVPPMALQLVRLFATIPVL